jgi:hypothetical protein
LCIEANFAFRWQRFLLSFLTNERQMQTGQQVKCARMERKKMANTFVPYCLGKKWTFLTFFLPV